MRSSAIVSLKTSAFFQRDVAVLRNVLQSLLQVQARIGIGRYRKWINVRAVETLVGRRRGVTAGI
jgi:hypothetical protein